MKKLSFLILVILFFTFSTTVFARVSVNDVYQAKMQAHEQAIAKLSSANQEKVKKAEQLLKEINLKVCSINIFKPIMRKSLQSNFRYFRCFEIFLLKFPVETSLA